ncbi:hypothetical protein NP493_141g01025 [Ridgeia piscesae]|uniref:LisH domain-containing protein n=1 Tax=Ridgeia piscesae TaxID=27915 RepID=A0AAD9UG44_RIDPI|nr:hypothetical protein NP493_141g01025 [Ridgeia piscesae]
MTDVETLTSAELKARLYHSLKEKGLVDQLKSQLRNRLVGEIRRIGATKVFDVEPVYAKEGSLLHKAANSLVADHLKRCSYDYSLSVFLPESATAIDKVFTTRDLLQLLNISSHSQLYQRLVAQAESSDEKKGFLWQLLCEVASQHGYSRQSMGVQTDPMRMPPPASLEDKFHKLDKYYDSMRDTTHRESSLGMEDRLLAYQRQLDERSHTEVKLEVARFCESELSRMRLEERDKFQGELAKIRRELEVTYQCKADGLLQRERHAIERLQKQQEMMEKETYSQRQSLLEEIDILRQREAEIRRREETINREHLLWEDKMRTKEESLKMREETVRREKMEYDQTLHNEVTKFRLDEQAKYMERQRSLEVRETRVQDRNIEVIEELQTIQQLKDELRDKRMRVNDLEGELTRVRHDVISFEKQNEVLNEKCREMVDYQIVRQENAVTKRELETTKMRLAEMTRDLTLERQKQEELLREMGNQGGQMTPEMMLMRRETEKLRNDLKQEMVVFSHQKQQLEQRLQQEIDRNHELLISYEEQSMQLKEMNAELRDLRQQLQQTRQALGNEVYRKPKGVNRSDSLCDLPRDDSDTGAHLVRNASHPQLHFSDTSRTAVNFCCEQDHVTTASQSEDYSYSLDIVRDTKCRLMSLEKEAQNLEENYRNFQFRVTSVGASLDHHPFPVHPRTPTKTLFTDNIGASPQLTGSRSRHSQQGHARSGRLSESRPVSSTPARATRETATGVERELHTPPRHPHDLHSDAPLLNVSMSTVRSDSPDPALPYIRGQGAVTLERRALSLADLEARPGSPPVVVLPGSDSSGDKVRSQLPVFKTNSVQVGPSGDSASEKTDKTDRGIGSIASDDARHRPTSTRSPDTSWNSQRGMCVYLAGFCLIT